MSDNPKRLTKAQRSFLELSARLGRVYVFPDQRKMAQQLEARGLIVISGFIEMLSEITPAGRAALKETQG